MRIALSLSVLFAALAATACEYSPVARGTPEQSYDTAPAASPLTNVPEGDPHFETYIGRYDVDRDK
jgi:hypothetical protein